MNSVHFSTGKDDWGTPQDLSMHSMKNLTLHWIHAQTITTINAQSITP